MRTVYVMKDNFGRVYIGSTSRSLKTRSIEHKSHSTFKFNYENFKIKKIVTTIDFVKIEEDLIEKAIKKHGEFCCNKSLGCLGPKGCTTEKQKLSASAQMKKMWLDPEKKKIILAGIKKSKAKNNVFEMSKKSHEQRWAKMKKWIAISKATGESFGPFQGYFEAKDVLKIHSETIRKGLNNKSKNRIFDFKYLEGELSQ